MSRFKYHDDSALASDPVHIHLARERFRQLFPPRMVLPNRSGRVGSSFEERLEEHMQMGDSRAAVVYSVEPFLVAAYTDELDCGVLLSFSDLVRRRFDHLEPGDRLLTINTYVRGRQVVRDLWNGGRSLYNFINFHPVIADFLSDDSKIIDARKKRIDEEEWNRCAACAGEYARRHPGASRNGDPHYSQNPPAMML